MRTLRFTLVITSAAMLIGGSAAVVHAQLTDETAARTTHSTGSQTITSSSRRAL